MQPQIITNKPGQVRPISMHSSSPRATAQGVPVQKQAASTPGEGSGKGPYLPLNTPTPSSNISHRDKVSFHIKQWNGINPSIPLMS